MLTRRHEHAALTLLELTVTLVILMAVAGLVVPLLTTTTDAAERRATLANMHKLRDILLGTPDRPGYLQDMQSVAVDSKHSAIPAANINGVPEYLHDLFLQPSSAPNFNIESKLGWRGPYLTNATGRFHAGLDPSFAAYVDIGLVDPPAVLDGWGNPIVIQWPSTGDPLETRAKYVRLVSAGPPTLPGLNGKLSVIDTLASELTPQDLTPNERGNDIVLFLRVSDPYAPDVLKAGP